ncbi:MAG: hypothetical protein ACREOK_09980 [Gemmatimonadaceae bacterium]
MQNTHGRTQLLGRAVLVALLVAPLVSASAQIRRDDRDRPSTSNAVLIESRDRDDEDEWLRADEDDDRRDRDRDRDRDLERVRRRDEERRLFSWRGVVDDDMRVYIRAGNVQSHVASGSTTRRGPRVDRDRALPRRAGILRVQLVDGRGRAHVIQQPSARNNYTAIVRVKDAGRGADDYRFVAYFDPVDRYDRDDIRYGGEARSGDRMMRWTGTVDRDIRITMRGGSADYSVASGAYPRSVQANVLHALPRRDGYLEVFLRQGRGTVQVIQQPTRYNNWTAIVRVLDTPGSFGYYDFDVIWR